MDPHPCVIDSDESLRTNLMAPNPMQRAIALHALEVEIERGAGSAAAGLATEVAKFTSRGIPYYSPHDPHFCEWVGRAVSYWQRLQTEKTAHRPMRARKRGA